MTLILHPRRLKTPMRILPTKLKILMTMEANNRVRVFPTTTKNADATEDDDGEDIESYYGSIPDMVSDSEDYEDYQQSESTPAAQSAAAVSQESLLEKFAELTRDFATLVERNRKLILMFRKTTSKSLKWKRTAPFTPKHRALQLILQLRRMMISNMKGIPCAPTARVQREFDRRILSTELLLRNRQIFSLQRVTRIGSRSMLLKLWLNPGIPTTSSLIPSAVASRKFRFEFIFIFCLLTLPGSRLNLVCM